MSVRAQVTHPPEWVYVLDWSLGEVGEFISTARRHIGPLEEEGGYREYLRHVEEIASSFGFDLNDPVHVHMLVTPLVVFLGDLRENATKRLVGPAFAVAAVASTCLAGRLEPVWARGNGPEEVRLRERGLDWPKLMTRYETALSAYRSQRTPARVASDDQMIAHFRDLLAGRSPSRYVREEITFSVAVAGLILLDGLVRMWNDTETRQDLLTLAAFFMKDLAPLLLSLGHRVSVPAWFSST